MSWKNLLILTGKADAGRYSEAMSAAGALAVSIEDASSPEAERPVFAEPGMPHEEYWDECVVAGLFDAAAEMESIFAALNEVVPGADYHWKLEPVAEQDWVRMTQAQFSPIQASSRIWVCPTWHTVEADNAIVITLDPGLAFGTGSHPTTRLCLRWLDAHMRGGETVLDYGCGSGILAIAASKLGAYRVIGTDIDENALLASRANATLNGAAAQFMATEALPDINADVVVANILAKPLQLLAPLLNAQLNDDGVLVLSGILREQADAVIAAYREFVTLGRWAEDAGWVCLAGRRKAL